MAATSQTGQATHPASSDPDTILRFRASERHMHWAIAMPFMAAWTTAAVLMFVYSSDPSRPYRDVFGIVHRSAGVALMVLPLLALLRHYYDIAVHLKNTREAWSWRWDDVKWLALMMPATIFKSITLPHQGKFNAAEKINFMVLTATLPLYAATGILIWTHQYAFAAWVVHLTMAGLATPLMFGHIFMAVVNPDTRVGLSGMFSGFVDRHWASHHYARWYHENFPQPVAADAAADAAMAVDASLDLPLRPQVALASAMPGADRPRPAVRQPAVVVRTRAGGTQPTAAPTGFVPTSEEVRPATSAERVH